VGVISAFININIDLGISETIKSNKQTPKLTFARMIVHVHATTVVLLLNDTQYAKPKHGVTQYTRQK